MKRRASCDILAHMDLAYGGGFRRTAAHSRVASAFGDGVVAVDVGAKLAEVAEEYDISDNPRDYIFEAVRAVTADVFNENGDGFLKSELLRFDHKLGQAVYQTFNLKPHHIQHRADNPKAARGVILDSHYNDLSEPLEICPNKECGASVKDERDRDEWGTRCRRCGETVKDEFVEILIAIDKKKDPLFAEGVRSGILNSTSMGCDVARTRCNVCGNVARSRAEFCPCIRNHKRSIIKSPDGKLKYAGEWCEGVVFEEDSRVARPADPSALQALVFEVTASVGGRRLSALELREETEELIRHARAQRLGRQAQTTALPQDPSFEGPLGPGPGEPEDTPPEKPEPQAPELHDDDRELLLEIEQELAGSHPEVIRKVRQLLGGGGTIPIEEMQEDFRQGSDPYGSAAAMGVEDDDFQGTIPVNT